MRLALAIAWAGLWWPAWAAVSSQQIQTVFGTTQGLTAATQSLSLFDAEMQWVANSSRALIVLQYTKRSMDKVGWISIGLGTGMSDADEIMIWPNSDYSWTLSHRAGEDLVLPSDQGFAPDLALVPALSSADSGQAFTQVALLRPLKATWTSTSTNLEIKGSGSTSIIYASSTQNPEDCLFTTSKLQLHDDGYSVVDVAMAAYSSGNVGKGQVLSGGGALQAAQACTISGPLSAKKGSSGTTSGGSNSTSSGGSDAISACTPPGDKSPYTPYMSFICPATGRASAGPLFWSPFLIALALAAVIPKRTSLR